MTNLEPHSFGSAPVPNIYLPLFEIQSLYRSIMQTLPDARQQSFEEIYGPPENFLEIEVPTIHPNQPPTHH